MWILSSISIKRQCTCHQIEYWQLRTATRVSQISVIFVYFKKFRFTIYISSLWTSRSDDVRVAVLTRSHPAWNFRFFMCVLQLLFADSLLAGKGGQELMTSLSPRIQGNWNGRNINRDSCKLTALREVHRGDNVTVTTCVLFMNSLKAGTLLCVRNSARDSKDSSFAFFDSFCLRHFIFVFNSVYDQEVLFQISITSSLNEKSIIFTETLKFKRNCLFKYYCYSDTCVNEGKTCRIYVKAVKLKDMVIQSETANMMVTVTD